jgi:hypothetical protein
LYVVAFESTSSPVPGAGSLPVLPLLAGSALADGTAPHLLDRDLVEVLPALWYCLQLPRTYMDVTDWPSAGALLLSHWLSIGHAILPVPVYHFGIVENIAQYQKALVFCPDRFLDELTGPSVAAGFMAAPVAFSALSDASLPVHWAAVCDAYGVPVPDDVPTALVRRLDLAGVSIPRSQIRRALGLPAGAIVGPEDLSSAAFDVWTQRAHLEALVDLGPDDVGQIELTSAEVVAYMAKARFNLTLTLPGVAPRYARRAYTPEQIAAFGAFPQFDPTDVWTPTPPASDAAAERAALEFVATHAAVASGALALTMPQVPPEAWTQLHMLERHLAESEGGKPWKVAQLLGRLDAACAPLWSELVVDSLRGASSVRVVGNFPLGLLTPPGHSVPLAGLVPVVQLPATPLTRAVELELDDSQSVDFSAGVRVLVAECIPPDDPVGSMSFDAMTQAAALLTETGSKVVVEVVQTGSVEAVRSAVAEHQPQILMISAHGYYPDDGSVSGLVIGEGLTLGADLGPMPPVVLLSACNTAVRGDGGPTVTDLLRKQGAYAVLGAQVPVNVFQNALLMGRLLVNLSELYAGRVVAESLLELWHHVQSTQLINDILASNRKLHAWSMTPKRGLDAPLIEFMLGIGDQVPLHRATMYQDTLARLLYVAEQMGDLERVRAWLPRRFVPETAFYQLVGEPERVMFAPPPASILADEPYPV